MSFKSMLFTLTALGAAAAVAIPFIDERPEAAPRKAPANIVLIVADDMGWGDNSIAGPGRFPTPNLAALAQSGVRLDRAYVTAAVCAPSRAALLTGRYQNRFGYDHLPGTLDLQIDKLPEEQRGKLGVDVRELTLADVLKTAGYTTAAIGKWHLGIPDQFYPTRRGFDEFYGFLGGQSQYIRASAPGAHFGAVGHGKASRHVEKRPPSTAIVRGPNRTPVDNFDTYLTDDLTDQGIKFIDKNKDKPFFLYLAYNAVHAPFEVTDKYYRRFPNITDENERIKAAMTSALDDGVGRVMGELDRLGLRENTLVVFLSDNGCAMYIDAAACLCQPLRGGKLSEYEGGLRTPMIVSWPARLPHGAVYSRTASALDIFPTAVAAARTGLPRDRVYDGVDLVPYLTGAKKGVPHKTLFWGREPYEAVMSGDWKLWRSRDKSVNMLFDVVKDRNEAVNRFDDRPDKVAELSKRMKDWQATMPPESFPSQGPVQANYCGVDLDLPT